MSCRARLTTVAVVVLALGLVACDGDDGDGSTTGTSRSTVVVTEPTGTAPATAVVTEPTGTAPATADDDLARPPTLADDDRRLLEDLMPVVDELPGQWSEVPPEPDSDDDAAFERPGCEQFPDLRDRALSEDRVERRFERPDGGALTVSGAVVDEALVDDYFDALVDPAVLACARDGVSEVMSGSAAADGLDVEELVVEAEPVPVEVLDGIDRIVGQRVAIAVVVEGTPFEAVLDARALHRGRYALLVAGEPTIGSVPELADVVELLARRLAAATLPD